MKAAAAHALAALAREDVPDELDAAYAGRRLRYGPEYILPVPFDPRLIERIPVAVAEAAMESGVAGKMIDDLKAYGRGLAGRLNRTAASLEGIFERVRQAPRRVVFAEGEEERVLRAAIAFQQGGYGQPIVVGREDRIYQTLERLGLPAKSGLEIHNARLSRRNQRYTDFLYERLHRKGFLYRDCQRLVNQDRNVFGACMLAVGDADALVTGLTRTFASSFDDITKAIDPRGTSTVFGMSMVLLRDRTILLGDTHIHEKPSAETLADIAHQMAMKARALGKEPRVALLSSTTFGTPPSVEAERVRQAVEILIARRVPYEIDGPMAADVALDADLMKLYPFCRLSSTANVLVMPDRDSANIAAKLLQKLSGGDAVGPLLVGLAKPVQIVPMGASVQDLVTAAVFAAVDAPK
jgi:malate dehydrogenase (oxaloacetate-decarboxylating)(NADP+)